MMASLSENMMIALDKNRIPHALQDFPSWVLWRLIDRDGEKTKVPYSVAGPPAKANDPSTWSSFAEVSTAFDANVHAGIGYEFAADDPFCGIDLDGCRDPETGEVASWAAEIISSLATYAEVSPSGTGVKLFILGKSPLPSGKKKLLPDCPKICDKAPAIEVYDRGRFFVVTGDRIDGPSEPQERQQQLDALAARFWPAKPAAQNGHREAPHGRSTSAIERARKYLAKVPPAVSGQGGHDATYHAAAVLCIDFDLGRDDAFALLSEWNEGCQPPWTERELLHKIDSAIAQGGERGRLLVNGQHDASDLNGSAEPPKKTPKQSKPRKQSSIGIPSSATFLDEAGRTDRANGRRFADMHRGKCLWNEPWGKWLVWDDRRWAVDGELQAVTFAKETSDALWRKIAPMLPEAELAISREILRFAHHTASARGIANMLSLAKSEPGMGISPDLLDTDHWVLNVLNGTLDLRTGKLRPHCQTDYMTKLCPVSYNPDAKCPNWENFVAVILARNAELIGFLQRCFGYSLTGSVAEQIMLLLYGTGSNGKSTFINAVIQTLGSDYAMAAPDSFLMVKQGQEHPTDRADLHGKRFISCSEVEEGRRLAESLVKQLTGGDPIRARRMKEDFWQFQPTHKIWMAANHKPVIRGTDRGIWRRVKMVPFTISIADDQQDKDLPEKLAAEREGILAWAVRGCLAWQQHGLGEPDTVKAATAEYRSEQDVLGSFLAEMTYRASTCRSKASELYRAYVGWCKRTGEYAINQTRFGRALNERGYEKQTSNGVWYPNVAIVAEGPE